MNKGAKKRAFFILLLICLIYISLGARLPERFAMKRVSPIDTATAQDMNIALNRPPAKPVNHPSAKLEPVPSRTERTSRNNPGNKTSAGNHTHANGPSIEPSFLIAVPIVCAAIHDGIIEKEGLIFIKRDGTSMGWKKPLEILRDKDTEGLKGLSGLLDRQYIIDLLRKAGVTVKDELTKEDIILGHGYEIEIKKITILYNTHVPQRYNNLFPFDAGGFAIRKAKEGYELTRTRQTPKQQAGKIQQEWVMPNLLNLSMKSALERLSDHTTNIRVYGNGNVVNQYPGPSDKVSEKTVCIIYGRTYRQ